MQDPAPSKTSADFSLPVVDIAHYSSLGRLVKKRKFPGWFKIDFLINSEVGSVFSDRALRNCDGL